MVKVAKKLLCWKFVGQMFLSTTLLNESQIDNGLGCLKNVQCVGIKILYLVFMNIYIYIYIYIYILWLYVKWYYIL